MGPITCRLPLAILAASLVPAAAPAADAGESLAIRRIDLVHLSHTDFGFTDHPAVCRELQVRYLDLAWRKEAPPLESMEDVAASLSTEPRVVINPALPEDPAVIRRL